METLHIVEYVVIASIAGILAFLLGRSGRTQLREEVDRLAGEAKRAESQKRDLNRQVGRMMAEQRATSRVLGNLPNHVRELNRSNLGARDLPDLVSRMTSALFEPDQLLLYHVSPKPVLDGGPANLELVAHRGLGDVPPELLRVPIGRGKIGWVAEHHMEMLAEDWKNSNRTDGRAIQDNHPSLRADLLGPLVHLDGGEERLLGVLCIGGPSVSHAEPKHMLQLVTNLGSIAQMNISYVTKLQQQANHDGLTHLMNKRFFLGPGLGEVIHAVREKAGRLGIFIFDIDHFKHYNDTQGHVAGDDLLKEISRVILASLEPGQLACRYGGEEFVIAMPGCDADDAMRQAEKLRATIASHPFPFRESQPLGRVSISGGVSIFPLDGDQGPELIQHADEALYKAKRGGRDRVELYRGVTIGDPVDASLVDVGSS